MDIAALVSSQKLVSDTLSYGAGPATGAKPSIISSYGESVGIVFFKLDPANAANGDTATLPVIVSGFTNYYPITVNINVVLTDKTQVTISGIMANGNLVYNGTAKDVNKTNANAGAASISNLSYTYEGTGATTYAASATAPTNAGDYKCTVTLTDAAYFADDFVINFTIAKATITITAENKTATAGSAEPSYTYIVSGLVSGETLATLPTVTCPTANMNAAGAYPITVYGAAAPAGGNYNDIVYVSGTLTVTAATFTVTFNANNGSVSPETMQTVADGKLTSLPSPSRSGYSFNGWFTAPSGGTRITTATVFTQNTTVFAHWTSTGGGGNTGGGDSSGGGTTTTDPTPNPTPAPTTTPPASGVAVDGKEADAGEVKTSGNTTTVTVNQDAINKLLETAITNVTITVPAETATAVAQLVVQNVDDMAVKNMTLTVQVGNTQYEIPATAIDTASILAALGAENAADVPMNITITTDMNAVSQAAVNTAIAASGGELVIPPMEFKITVTYNGQTVEIDMFSQYVTRSVEITAAQAANITTAIVVDPDGTVRHVPTRVYQSGGKWYAEVNSLTNSTYAFVHNEKTFTDARGKWYENTVNEMASRMIISGVGENLFAGERDITRAEFAAIIIRALGLPSNGNGTVFTDVSRSAWYCGAVGTAYEYGLVSGVGNNQFAPDRKITRQEAMLMIQRAAKIAGFTSSIGNLNAFTDSGKVSDWALNAALWNVGSGLVVGSDGKIRPMDNITRAETATLVLKLLQKAGLVDVRTPLTTAQATRTMAAAIFEPRKEPDPIILPDDNDDESPDPNGDGHPDSDTGDAMIMR